MVSILFLLSVESIFFFYFGMRLLSTKFYGSSQQQVNGKNYLLIVFFVSRE